MTFIKRFVRRICFRRKTKGDESTNVVDSMVKANRLYKELCIKAHPDKNGERIEIAEDLMIRIDANRYNYSALLLLKKEADEKLK